MAILNSIEFYKDYWNKTLYLRYDFEDCVLKVTANNGTWVKFKGKEEFKALHGSKIVAEAYLSRNMITEEEYNNF